MTRLRLTAAVNFFKGLILGDAHIPGRPQTKTLFDSLLTTSECKEVLAERTWDNWYSSRPTTPKRTKLSLLDSLATNHILGIAKAGHAPGKVVPIFSELVLGGLMAKILVGSPKDLTPALLKIRADEYAAVSPFHLFLDAVEVDAFSEDMGGLRWTDIKSVAAHCILRQLHSRWSPRHGEIYSTFPSDLKIKWRTATEVEKAEFRAAYSRMTPNLFQAAFDSGATPSWRDIGVTADIPYQHIHKLLFAVAAEPDFLVEERLEAWAVDLATAMHAMHALAWTDRYETFGGAHLTDELLFWMALDHIFYDGDVVPVEVFDWDIEPAMRRCDTDWTEASFVKFAEARTFVREQLYILGLTVEDVQAIASNATKVHPLIFRG